MTEQQQAFAAAIVISYVAVQVSGWEPALGAAALAVTWAACVVAGRVRW